MAGCNILAISGGGVRGILAAKIIERLEASSPFLSNLSLVSGTSTGSIIAAGIASGKFSPSDIVDLYRKEVPTVFERNFLDRITTFFGLYKARYSAEGLKRVMRKVFGDMRMKDLRMRVLIPAIDLGQKNQGFRAKFFDNFKDSYDLELKVCDVVTASCSGPTYFPAHRVATPAGVRYFADGGVVCNHPSVAAICAALDPISMKVDLADIACLSVTTGAYPMSAMGWRERGIIGWIDDIFDLLQEQFSTVQYQADKLLLGPRESRFHVVHPMFTQEIKFDDAKALPTLEAMGAKHPLEPTIQWMNRNFAKKGTNIA
jgi:patatin-like phospholipase/acyl hydrolase